MNRCILLTIFLIIISVILLGCTLDSPIEVDIPESIDQQCVDFCLSNEDADTYLVEYNPESELFDCSCFDISEAVVASSSLNISEDIDKDEPRSDDEQSIKWASLPITYYVTNENKCGRFETRQIEKAFDRVTEATEGIVTFKKVDKPANIDVRCTLIEDCYSKSTDIQREGDTVVVYRYESICKHTLGIAQITELKGNQISKATIEIIGLAGFVETTGRGTSGFYVGTCGGTDIEVHEILHVFGYQHLDDPNSIMYYAGDVMGFTIREEGQCLMSKKEIDKVITDDLISTYSEP